MALKLAVIGASGKMGKQIVASAIEHPEFDLVSACSRAGSQHLGTDLGSLVGLDPIGIFLSADKDYAMKLSDVVVDFSLPGATHENTELALRCNRPLLIGSTGHSATTQRFLESAAKHIPILYSPNFSIGMGLCIEATRMLSKSLKGSCHIDIIESHHIQKKDTPSGTALSLASATGLDKVLDRPGIDHPRPTDTVFIHSLRRGNVIGEHTIIFTCQGETIELKHQVTSRETFARGALKAATFLHGKPPGLYSFKDVFYTDCNSKSV